MAHHLVVTALPEQGFAIPVFNALASGQRQQVDAVDLHALELFSSGRSSQGGHYIDMGNRAVHGGTGRNFCRPFDKQRHAEAAFEHGNFPAAIGAVHIINTDVSGAAVIAGKDHNGIVRQPLCFQGIHNAPYAAIQCANHGRVNTLAMRLDVAHSFIIFAGGL